MFRTLLCCSSLQGCPRLSRCTLFTLVLLLLGMAPLSQAATTLHVSAAASLTDTLDEAIAQYQQHNEVSIVPIYASSSTLARQIANGAPADLFLSANNEWMDWLEEQGVNVQQRTDLLQNRLALIAPTTSEMQAFTPGEGAKLFTLLGAGERLSVGDPDHVPVGIYAQQALETLDEWDTLAPRLAHANDVRGALTLVERGETPLGIVYQTDARASDRVRILGLFPLDSHDSITYPVALIGSASDTQENAEAAAFRVWLESEDAMAIFTAHGFSSANDANQ